MAKDLESVTAILGEHFENYVILVADSKHSCKIIFDNHFAAKGLVSVAKNTIDESFGSGINCFEIDFGPLSDD
tara:strand:+ start:713 stop:931 length:219 start_codon:yes stop_codon:yes gene_type:complete